MSPSPTWIGVSTVPSGKRTPPALSTPRALKIADEDRLETWQVGAFEDSLGELQRRTEARDPRPDLGIRHEAPQAGAVDRRPGPGLGPVVEQDDGGAIVGSQPIDRIGGRVLGRRPAVVQTHAVGAVKQNDDLARAIGDGRQCRRAKERPGERQDEEQQRGASQQQQEPVPDALTAKGVKRGSCART